MYKITRNCVLAMSLTVLTLTACAQQEASGPAILIEGATLIDGNGGEPVADSAVLIQGNRITGIGARGDVDAPDGAQVIDATGKFITPGLIDAKSNYASNFGEAYMVWGVTSAIWSGGGGDAGTAERDAINHGMFAGPRLFVSFTAIRGPGNGPEPKSTEGIPGRYGYVVRTPEEARDLAIKVFDAGADFISAADGDGPPEVFAALVDEAHKRGKSAVMRTVGVQVTAEECADIGCDVVIHTGNIGNRIAHDPDKWYEYVGLPPDQYADMDDAKVPAMIEHLVNANLALEPDLIATGRGFPRNWDRVQEENATFFQDPNLLAYFPEYQIQGYIANVADPETYLTPEQMDIRRRGFDNHVRFLKMFVDAGGHILPASDIPQSPPGLGVHQEMAVFQEDVGLTPMQTLQSATKWAAEHFYLEDLGVIEEGKLADLIIVNADPTENILNLREIDTVIKDGEVQHRTYNADYLSKTFQAGLSRDGTCCFATPVVEGFPYFGGGRIEALKAVSKSLVGVDGWAGGGPESLDIHLPRTPAIEGIMPYLVPEGSPETTVTLTGFNFARASAVYVDGEMLPAESVEPVSPTELRITLGTEYLSPGTRFIFIENPEPLSTPTWGNKSNFARLLIPYSFTTQHSNNEL